ncbi:MAG: BON domain-containing protein [Acidobacteriia bacterium]|nr:BON domain-containing protein [Terriglobia bacterium]
MCCATPWFESTGVLRRTVRLNLLNDRGGLMKLTPLLFTLGLLLGCRTNETPREQVNDLEITASVKSKLASDLGLSTVPDISVNSTNAVVTLSGQVDSAATKEKAERIAGEVSKVRKVVDNLQVATAR